jgi:hypothetical protein
MTKQVFTRLRTAGFLVGVLSAVLLLTSSAQATLILTPGGPNQAITGTPGPGPGQPAIDAVIFPYMNGICGETVLELYKQDAGGGEAGSFAGSYSTTFSPTSDPEDATITWGGGTTPYIDCDCIFALVKDGNANPIWYLFNISGWDGQETLQFNDFWPGSGPGAISHVSIYGCDDGPGGGGQNPVPEPASMLIWSLGLAGLGLAAHRRRKALAAI